MILTQQKQIAQILAPAADRFTGTQNGTPVNLELYGHVAFLVQHGAGGTGTYTIQLEAASSLAFSDAETIPFKARERAVAAKWGALTDVAATGHTVTAGADQLIAVELDAAGCPEGKPFVRVKTTEVVDSPVAGAVLAVLAKATYQGDDMETGLA